MQLAQVKVDKPGIFGGSVVLVLGVVAVSQSAVRKVVVAFGVDGAVPAGLLKQHDFAVGVEDRGECSGAGHAGIVIDAAPGGDCGVDIAVGGTEAELLFNDRRKTFAELHSTGWFGRVTAGPRVLELIILRA